VKGPKASSALRALSHEPSPNRKPASKDIEHAFALFWGIGRVFELFGLYVADPRYKKAGFPSDSTKPTEKECRAALARVLTSNKIPGQLLREVANAVCPEGGYMTEVSRRLTFDRGAKRKRQHDKYRDFTIAAEMYQLMNRQGLSYNEACAETAKRADISPDRCKKIYGRHKAFLESLSAQVAQVRRTNAIA
jgi:hypothetical protein